MFKKLSITLSAIVIASMAFIASAEAATTTVNINFRSAPSLSSIVYQVVPKGESVEVLGHANDHWLNVDYNGQVGYMSTKYVDVTPQEDKALNIIAEAESLIGTTHYQFGVNQAPTLLDCSSFTKYVYGQNGISLIWSSRSQAKQGTYVDKSALQPGDLVFFTVGSSATIGHVGIYIGNGQMISNVPSANGPKVTSIVSGYWANHYVTARRVIQ